MPFEALLTSVDKETLLSKVYDIPLSQGVFALVLGSASAF